MRGNQRALGGAPDSHIGGLVLVRRLGGASDTTCGASRTPIAHLGQYRAEYER